MRERASKRDERQRKRIRILWNERERENETQMSNDSLLELKGKKSDDLTIVIIELISDIIDEIDRL